MGDYEKQEIMDYEMVYYLNTSERNGVVRPPTTPEGPENNGFDNDRFEYICEPKCHIAFRYEVKKIVGSGSFG